MYNSHPASHFIVATQGLGTAFLSTGCFLCAFSAYVVLFEIPPDYQMGSYIRWLYPHTATVFCAMILQCLLMFAVFSGWFTPSILRLLIVRAVVLTSIMLIILSMLCGALWATVVWGDYWVWDARTVATASWCAMLVLLYVSVRPTSSTRQYLWLNIVLIVVGTGLMLISHVAPDIFNTLHQASRLSRFDVAGYADVYIKPLITSLVGTGCICAGFIISAVRRQLVN